MFFIIKKYVSNLRSFLNLVKKKIKEKNFSPNLINNNKIYKFFF